MKTTQGFPGGSDGKESACHVGDPGSIPELAFPGGGHNNPVQYSCLENPHEQRNLVGYSPQSHKKPDMTEQLSTAQHVLKKPPNYFHNGCTILHFH